MTSAPPPRAGSNVSEPMPGTALPGGEESTPSPSSNELPESSDPNAPATSSSDEAKE